MLKNIDNEFLSHVYEGLSSEQKYLNSKYFYDKKGSEIFDQICKLDEYYLTRVETELLKNNSEDISRIISNKHLIEFGSGSSIKTRILLENANNILSYIPIDISETHLIQSSKKIKKYFPSIKVTPICADFTKNLKLPEKIKSDPKVIFFPGSTIGNFGESFVKIFLKNIRILLNKSDGLLIGVDLIKDEKIIYSAYNDKQGVTKRFNQNILERINKELKGTFVIDNFEHEVIFNKDLSRLEMYLKSNKDQVVQIMDKDFKFSINEKIHTENSYKYEEIHFLAMGKETGFNSLTHWKNKNTPYGIYYLTPEYE